MIRYRMIGVLGLMAIAAAGQSEPILSLEGAWRFALDRSDVGVKQKWFSDELKTSESVFLPGSLQEQGFGEKPSSDTEWTTRIGKSLLADPRFQEYLRGEKFLSPFWLTPERYYVGPAWYQRSVTIPKDWKGRRIVLHLERPHWQTAVWVDDTPMGTHDALGTPHEYVLTEVLSPGRHRLTIRVDNRIHVPVGRDAHSVSDQTQTNWNGITGRLFLKARPAHVWFDDIQVFPDIQKKLCRVSMAVGRSNPKALKGILRIRANNFNSPIRHAVPERVFPVDLSDTKDRLEVEYEMGNLVQLWDEFSPVLYRMTLRFEPADGGEPVEQTVVFGMREVGVEGTRFTINGRPIFLRGTLECCIFPKTGYPPTDIHAWKRILRICRAHGLNHIRFHSWCPPQAAFQAADEMGFYIQAEASCWAAFGGGSAVDAWIYDECRRMLKAYGNHPSFLLMSPSNEPHGGEKRDVFLGKLIDDLSKQDARRLYTTGSGWPLLAQNQFHVAVEPRMRGYKPLRLSDQPQTRADYRAFVARYKVPVISHEIGQWCAYPNLSERFKYDGSLRGGHIEIARDLLDKAGLLNLGHDFLMASGRFQTLLYKAEIEAALRTPGLGGFQLLDLHDFPGQGMAPVGVLDCFWQPKGYVSAQAYRRFCGPTVPLARLRQRVFTSDQPFEAMVDLAHYGAEPITARPIWTLRDRAGRVLLSGSLPETDVPTGCLTTLGTVRLSLERFEKAQKLNFEVALEHTGIVNDWDFWVYPARLEPSKGEDKVRITEVLDEAAEEVLKKGGKVLLIPRPQTLKSDTTGSFSPIFWNRITFPEQPIHTLGILCNPEHPVFQRFPTDFHSNWQWWDLLEHSKPMVLDELPSKIEPLVRVIDDWTLCRSLGILFEVSVEKGKLLVCSIDIQSDLEKRPVARQLRYSVLDYMSSAEFDPAERLPIQAVHGLFREPTRMEKLHAQVIYTSSGEDGYGGSKAIDGNPDTFWHTRWQPNPSPRPHEIQIKLAQSVQIIGFTYLPRQDGNKNGRIAEYECYVSDDVSDWGRPAATGILEDNPNRKTVRFDAPHKGRFVRLVSRDGFDGDPHTSVAEIDLLIEP